LNIAKTLHGSDHDITKLLANLGAIDIAGEDGYLEDEEEVEYDDDEEEEEFDDEEQEGEDYGTDDL
jgi:hypothetical protein